MSTRAGTGWVIGSEYFTIAQRAELAQERVRRDQRLLVHSGEERVQLQLSGLVAKVVHVRPTPVPCQK
jgi:hypothetical protein